MKLGTFLSLGALAATTLTACSLLLPFNPDGQPCDALGACEVGYGCVDENGARVCRLGADAGVDCSRCPAGGCIPGTNECLPNTCQYKICPANFECVETEAGPACRTIPTGADSLGFLCYDDTGCTPYGTSRRCMMGAIPTATDGTLRNGICVDTCTIDNKCVNPAFSCREFQLGPDAGVTRVCLPTNTITACNSNEACARASLVCTVFDHPELGPLTACDTAVPSGVGVGQSCVRTPPDAGTATFCANGLCAPDPAEVPNQNSTCLEVCGANTCSGQYCAPVQFAVQDSIRYVPMCIPQISNCFSCEADPLSCKPDAPHCTLYNGAPRCLGECTPGVTQNQCPPSYKCAAVDAGTFRCVPESDACP